MWILRTVLYLLLVLVILQPVLQLRWDSEEPPEYAVLVDASLSMATADPEGTRYESILRIAEDAGWAERIGENGARIRWVLFDKTGTGTDADKITPEVFSGRYTDLGAGYAALTEKKDSAKNVAGIFLLSDGLFNTGPSAADHAVTAGLPVYTVAMGDTVEPADIYLTKTEFRSTAIAGRPVSVTLQAGSKGVVDQDVFAELYHGKTLLQKKKIRLSSSGALWKTVLTAVPKREGLLEWTVAVSGLKDERNLENNYKKIWVRVTKEKLKTAALFRTPCPDARFIQKSIRTEKAMTVRTAFLHGNNRIIDVNGYVARAVREKADVLLVHDCMMDKVSAETDKMLKDYVRAGHGLILMGQSALAGSDGRLSWLPFRKPAKRILPKADNRVTLTRWGRTAPVMHKAEMEPLDWERMKPVPYYRTAANTMGITALSVEQGKEKDPLLCWKRYGKGKVLFFLGTQIWEWCFTEEDAENRSVRPLWPGWIRWMATAENARRFYVDFNQKSYTQGDNMVLTAELYDAAMRPVADAEIEFVLMKNGKETSRYRLSTDISAPGMYSTSIPLLDGGTFQYTCRATLNGTSAGVKKGDLEIKKNPLELEKLAADRRIMRKIAKETGGRNYTPDAFMEQIHNDISYAPIPVMNEKKFRPGSSVWLLVIWIAGFSVEWFLRKRWKIE